MREFWRTSVCPFSHIILAIPVPFCDQNLCYANIKPHLSSWIRMDFFVNCSYEHLHEKLAFMKIA